MFLDARRDPFITVGTFGTPEQAHLARMMLEAYEIECHLADEYTVAINLYFSHAIGGVKLMVRKSESSEAIELLQIVDATTTLPAEEGCPQCGSRDVGYGRLKLLAVICIILAIDLPPPVAAGRACAGCGYRWKAD